MHKCAIILYQGSSYFLLTRMRNVHEEELVMKRLLTIMMLLMMSIELIGCGGKSESSGENTQSVDATEETVSRVEPIKCENHGAEIIIPGEYSLISDSNENDLVYSNSDGSKAIGFGYAQTIDKGSTSSISWDSIVERASSNMTIETYENISLADLPGIKFFFTRAGGMAIIIAENKNYGYTIQMAQNGEFDEESTFEEILESFRIVQKTGAIEDKSAGHDTITESMTDMELLTFEGHPKYLDDYDSAKQKWGKDDRVTLLDGDIYSSYKVEGSRIIAKSRGTTYIGYEKYKNNKLESIEISFQSCNDEASSLPLDDALSIIRSYLPLEVMKEKYHITDSVQWPDKENSGKSFFIRYEVNEDISEDEYEEEGLTGSICVVIWVNQDGTVRGTRLDVMGVLNYLGTEYTEWNYDFIKPIDE